MSEPERIKTDSGTWLSAGLAGGMTGWRPHDLIDAGVHHERFGRQLWFRESDVLEFRDKRSELARIELSVGGTRYSRR